MYRNHITHTEIERAETPHTTSGEKREHLTPAQIGPGAGGGGHYNTTWGTRGHMGFPGWALPGIAALL